MSTIKRIAKNTVWLMVAQLVTTVLGLIYLAYMMRHLGPEGWGVISYALSLTAILSVLLDLGLNTLITREIARDGSVTEKYTGNLLVLKLLLAVSLFAVVAIAVNLIGYSGEVATVIELILLSIIFTSISQFFYNILQANEIMEYQAIGSIMTSLLMLAGALFAIYKNYNVVGFAAIYAATNLVVLIYSIAVCVKEVGLPHLEVDLRFWRLTLRESIPYGLGGFFGTIYYYIDSVMLYPMQGEAAVGWYNTAYRLFMYVLFIPQILSTTLFPVMARLSASSKSSVKLAYEKFFKYMAMLGIPLGVGTTILAEKIIYVLFGSGYNNSVIALQILIWSAVFIFFSIPFGCLFNSLSMQRIGMKIAFVCSIFNVVSNLIMIPSFSYIGASITTVLTELLSFLLYFYAGSHTEYGLSRRMAIDIIKIMISSSIMGGIAIFMYHLNVIILIVLSVTVYFIALLLLQGIDDDDIAMLRQVIRLKTMENGT
jgi:O-antigen/teichoic acid export membrane protein